MRRIREILRLKSEGRSHREISVSVGVSPGSVSDYVTRAASSGVTWESASTMTDDAVERALFRHVGRNEPRARAAIDFAWVHRELRRSAVTLQLLWSEYRDAARARSDATPYQYSQFCDLYSEFRDRLSPVMRQVHRAGERAFVDYSGKKPSIVNRATGEHTDVELFVMVLGASNYTYAEATHTQGLEDFVRATVRGFEYFGGVPEILVPDQLRSAVSGPDRYDPEINPTYAEMAAHYGVAVIPARPRKPRDKAKVEVAVQITQRWILACLRNRTFFDLATLNDAIAELLERLNTRPFQKLEGTRRSMFESLDRPALRPLPKTSYVPARWKKATVNIDYHFDYDGRLYSVHHTLLREAIEVSATTTTIEAWHRGIRVASHVRSYAPKGTATTLADHRPKSHRDYGEWPPERMVSWARSIGPSTAGVVEKILARNAHPEQGFRTCLALMRDAKSHGLPRMEAACARALHIGSPTRKSVQMILRHGLDRVGVDDALAVTTRAPIEHEHVRGGDYFERDPLRKPPVH